MPRVDDSSGGGGFRRSGIYEKLLEGRCRCGRTCRSDPRLWLQDLTDEQSAQLNWFKAQCGWEASLDKAERLAEGAPIVMASWQVVGGHTGIPRDEVPEQWDHRSVQTYKIFSDDKIVPHEYRDR